MACELIKTPNGAVMVCSRGASKKYCACGRISSRLCDYKLYGPKEGQTCDRPLCEKCTTKPDINNPDIDYCMPHYKLSKVD